MKKMLSDFELFECTNTPLGLMMRVMDGWVVNGAFIPFSSAKIITKEVEVYDENKKSDKMP